MNTDKNQWRSVFICVQHEEMNARHCNFGQTLVLASPVSGRDGWLLAVPVHGWMGYGRAWHRAEQNDQSLMIKDS